MATDDNKSASYSPELTQALARAVKALDSEARSLTDSLEKPEAKGQVRTLLIQSIEEAYQSADLIRGTLKRHGTARAEVDGRVVIRPYTA